MTSKHLLFLVIAMTGATIFAPANSSAQIPLELATEAAAEAIRACTSKNYNVVATVINPDGVIKVQLRGDGSPVHSLAFSFRKAFTTVSMGPMFGVDSSSGVIKFITLKNPVGLNNVGSGNTDLLFLPGGVLLQSKGQTIGALGVSGAPVSTEDEVCARAGADKVRDSLNK